MSFTVNLYEAGVFVLFSLSAVMCIFLILTVRSINKFVKRVDVFAEVNKDAIGDAIAQILESSTNFNSVSRRLIYGIDSVGTVVGSLNNIVVGTASAVGSGASNVIDGIAMLRNILRTVSAIFLSKRKNGK